MAENHDENNIDNFEPLSVESENENKRVKLNNRLRFILYALAISLAAIFLFRMFKVIFLSN